MSVIKMKKLRYRQLKDKLLKSVIKVVLVIGENFI